MTVDRYTRAIVVQQPWASLIAIGAKTIETRSVRTYNSGPLVVYASKRWARDQAHSLALEPIASAFVRAGFDASDWLPDRLARRSPLPLGGPVAVVDLTHCREIVATKSGPGLKDPLDGIVDLVPSSQIPFGDFTPRRWAWLVRNPFVIDRSDLGPIDGGRQGFFFMPDRIVKAIDSQLQATS